jgi:chemotaxis protein methyltransferase CheR
MEHLRPFHELIRERCGLAFDDMAEANLTSAVSRRMATTNTENSSLYFAGVLSDEDEFNELVALLTVNETYFFREPERLTLLVETLVPRLLVRGGPVRILSAGCSTGEEPYSIAIALRERFGQSAATLFSIVAGDIDREALKQARQAIYRDYSFRLAPPALRRRYFSGSAVAGYSLDADVRGMVEFRPMNLLSPDFAGLFGGFDIVFYRNVSIYFDQSGRKKILTALSAAMNETSYLIVSAAETLANDLGVFHLVGEGGQFYFGKGDTAFRSARLPSPAAKQAGEISGAGVPPKKLNRLGARASSPAYAGAGGTNAGGTPALPGTVSSRIGRPRASAMAMVRGFIRDKKYQDALASLQAWPPGNPADRVLPLLEGYVRLQMREFAKAAAIAKDVIDADNWSAEAHVLLGLVSKCQEKSSDAIDWFKRTIYFRPNCWPAHYFLATLLHPVDAEKAYREFRTALQQLEADPDPDGGLQLPLDLPVADVRFLCGKRTGAPKKDGGKAAGALGAPKTKDGGKAAGALDAARPTNKGIG